LIARSDRTSEMRTKDRMVGRVAVDGAIIVMRGGAVQLVEHREPSGVVLAQAVAVLTAVLAPDLEVVSERGMSQEGRVDAAPTHPLIEVMIPDQRHEPRGVLRSHGGVLPPRRTVAEGPPDLPGAASHRADGAPALTGVPICGVARWIAVGSSLVVTLPGGLPIGETRAAVAGDRERGAAAPAFGAGRPCDAVRTSADGAAGIAAAAMGVADPPIVTVASGEIGVAIGNAVRAGHEAWGAASARAEGAADTADRGPGPAGEDLASASRVGTAVVISRAAVALHRVLARAATASG
jgi:hypothetical protein